MRVTEHELSWLLLGAAIGSAVTYWHLTKEKRIIAGVRGDLAFLANFHELNKAQYRKLMSKDATEELVDDQQVLMFYRWAQRLKNASPPISGIKKINTIRVAAEVIICQELLGLSYGDAVRTLLNAKHLDDLRTLLPKSLN
jgi:hypothetical protein